jgi:UDP-N-acetyl-D-mannosaminuronic acid transferase (WecB/TagA/CpsF family)
VGFEKRAPKIIRKVNLEWAWRLLQNPKKNWQKVKDSIKLVKYLVK